MRYRAIDRTIFHGCGCKGARAGDPLTTLLLPQTHKCRIDSRSTDKTPVFLHGVMNCTAPSVCPYHRLQNHLNHENLCFSQIVTRVTDRLTANELGLKTRWRARETVRFLDHAQCAGVFLILVDRCCSGSSTESSEECVFLRTDQKIIEMMYYIL
jgi:hypothetical protein